MPLRMVQHSPPFGCSDVHVFAGNSLRQNMRRAGFAFFGIFNGTEFNPNFFEDIEQAVDRKKGAVLVCSIGGILEPLGRGGRQSRYAMVLACIIVYVVYLKHLVHLKAGMLQQCMSLDAPSAFLCPLFSRTPHCRSLMAAYELVSKGYKNVSILKGGFLEWERSGR